MKNKWYEIQGKSSTAAEILLYDQVGKRADGTGVSAQKFIAELQALKVDEIILSINSCGGSVFEGNAIYNALRSHRAKIHAKVDGIAASIASVIAMSGDTIEMPENAMMMVHNPWTFAAGDADEMRKAADMLDKIKVGIVAAYHNKTKLDTGKIENLMADETWMTASECKALGFCDTVTEPAMYQASFEALKQFRNVPGSLIKNQYGANPMKTQDNDSIEVRCQAEWSADPDLRDEFRNSYSAYLAYRKAEVEGRVGIVTGTAQTWEGKI